jgi:hypothetical protein
MVAPAVLDGSSAKTTWHIERHTPHASSEVRTRDDLLSMIYSLDDDGHARHLAAAARANAKWTGCGCQ